MKKTLFTILIALICVTQINAKYAGSDKTVNAFIENKGQILDQNNNLNPGVLYLFNAPSLKVQLHKNGFSYEVISQELVDREGNYEDIKGMRNKDRVVKKKIIIHSHRVDIELVGCNANALISPLFPSTDYTNYYTTGTGEMGVTGVRNYGKVVYRNIYSNIDLEYLINEGKFKYNFIVHPGGNIADIKMKYTGATKTELNKKGEINLVTAQGNMQETIPYSFMEENNKEVSISYTSNNNIFGFKGNYNKLQTLVIDPTPNRSWGTYYGGIDGAEGQGVCVDASGNIYFTGATPSTGFMASVGAHQTVYGGSYDAFLAKFDASGATRAWGTYYGGSVTDEGNSVQVDANGNVYMAGKSSSSNAISTAGAHQTVLGGNYDAFVAKFNSSGVRQFGTYFGGLDPDYAEDIVLDANANFYITGWTMSVGGIATAGVYSPTYLGGGNFCGYVAKFNSSGVRQWGTYYGDGSGTVRPEGISLDASTNVYITGATGATSGIATAGAHQVNFGGGALDAFAAKFNSTGTALTWGTYLGDVYDADAGRDIRVDAAGNVIFVGYMESLSNISTVGAHQTVKGGLEDGFVAKLNSNGAMQWCTYYGGSDYDQIYGITTDSNNDIYFTGDAWSQNGTTIATANSYQSFLGGADDCMIVKLNAAGVRQWGSYYGDIGSDWGTGIALASGNDVVVGGFTGSNVVMGSPGAFMPNRANPNPISLDAFLTKFGVGGGGGQAPVAAFNVNDQTICAGTCINFTDASVNVPTVWSWTFPGSNTPTSNAQNPSNICYNNPGTYVATLTATNANGNNSTNKTITVFPLPNICAAATNQSICAGSSTTLTSCGGTSYTWQPGNLNGAIVVVSPNVTTTYTVTGTDANGCVNTGTITIYVSNNPLPTVTLANLTAVCVDAVAFPLSGGAPAGGTYSGTGVTNGNFDPAAAGVGTHTISYTYTDPNNGCYNAASKSIVVNPLPTQPTIGVNFNILTSSAASGNQWYLNNNPINGATSQSYTILSGGAYMVCVTDANGCQNCSQPLNMNNVGVDENMANIKVSISPNPFNENLRISLENIPTNETSEILLCDMLGQTIAKWQLANGNSNIEFNASELSSGIYFVTVKTNSSLVKQKIVKQ